MLFLFKKEALGRFSEGLEINSENFYEFFPWDFGPFSSQIYDDLAFFELRGFIEKTEAEEDTLPESAAEWEKWLAMTSEGDEAELSEYSEDTFCLSTKGMKWVAPVYESLSPQQKRLLKEFKSRTVSVPLKALLTYVYKNYEDQTGCSKIKEEILGR